jgi:hypothetical protein
VTPDPPGSGGEIFAEVSPLLSRGGTVRLYTRRDSLLGRLIGGNTISFFLNLRGVFATGSMPVAVLP